MTAFHRNIRPKLLERLRDRARRDGRSVNPETLCIVDRELSRPGHDELETRLRDLHRRIRLSPDAPTPEQLIREDRDSR